MGRKVILLILLCLMVVPVAAFGCSDSDSYRHYESKELCFSLDYPERWESERISQNNQIFTPDYSGNNAIWVVSEYGEPTPNSMIATYMPIVIDEFCAQAAETSNYQIISSAATSGKWNWLTKFSMVHNDATLQGRAYYTQTQTVGHTLIVVQDGSWPEGNTVLNSFASLCP